jgi:hypothetical protein
MSGNEQVLVEIQTFLVALASYADRVASDPKVTFEEHHVSLMGPISRDDASQPLARAARVGSR